MEIEHNQNYTGVWMKLSKFLPGVILMILCMSQASFTKAQNCSQYYTQGASRCGSGSVTLRVLGGPTSENDDIQYQWYQGSTLLLGETNSTLNVNVSTSTTYKVRVDDFIDNCTVTINAVATINTPPAPPNLSNDSRCGEGEVTLSVISPSGSYLWYFDSNGTNPIPTNDDAYVFSGAGNSSMTTYLTSTHTYWARSSSNGCVSSGLGSVMGIINSFPQVDAGSTISACSENGVLNLVTPGVTPTSGGTWSSSNSSVNTAINNTNQTIDVSTLSTGTYILTYRFESSQGCARTDTRQLIIRSATPAPRVNGGKTTERICSPGGTVQLIVDGESPDTDPVNGTYAWYNSASSPTPFSTQTSVDITTSVDRTVWLTAKTGSNCTSVRTAISILIDPAPPNPLLQDAVRCGEGEITLSVTNPSGTCIWYFDAAGQNPVPTNTDDYAFSGTGNSSMTFYLTGSQSFFVKMVSGIGCESSSISSVNAEVKPFPDVEAGLDLSSCQESVPLNLLTPNVLPVADGVWTSANSTVNAAIDNVNQTLLTNSITPGTYQITYSYTSVNGCTSTDSRQLIIQGGTPAPTVNGGKTNEDVCADIGLIQLTVDGEVPGLEPVNGIYQWYNSSTATEALAVGTSIEVFTTDTTVWLLKTDAAGCPSSRVPITISELPSAPMPNDPEMNINLDPYSTTLNKNNVSTAAITYYWQRLATGEDESDTGETLINPISGFYMVRGKNVNGCWGPSSGAVEVINHRMPDYNLVPDNLNFVRSYQFLLPSNVYNYNANLDMENDPAVLITETQYLDGLGRQIQQVSKKASPLQYDVKVPIVYDVAGKVPREYLPYRSSSSDGSVSMSPLVDQSDFYKGTYEHIAKDSFPFAYYHHEKSSRNFASKTSSPGSDWISWTIDPLLDRSNRYIRRYNKSSQDGEIFFWDVDVNNGLPHASGEYEDATLYTNVSVDEEDHAVIEFVDKQGQTVLKRVQAVQAPNMTTYTPGEWADTYYVYDDFGNLSYVLPPKAVQELIVSGSTLPNPYLKYRFSTGSGTAAVDDINSFNGTINGASWASGKQGQGLSFDGVDDKVTVAHSATLNITNNLSASAWIKAADPGASGGIIVGKHQGGNVNNQRGWIMSATTVSATDSDKLQVVISENGTSSSGNLKIYYSSLPVFDNNWHHVGFTFSSNELKLYVDGVEDINIVKFRDDHVSSINANDEALTIGWHQVDNAATRFFNGIIDEVAIYDQ
ncbi:MAG: LamG-like jellyroll fold domain-containing protein, partial [Bacteroidota bacterium]